MPEVFIDFTLMRAANCPLSRSSRHSFADERLPTSGTASRKHRAYACSEMFLLDTKKESWDEEQQKEMMR